MKLLITGANGQIGRALCMLAKSEQIEHEGLSSAQLDITREHKVWRTLRKLKPDFVINTAAYTQLDAAEDDIDRCQAVNRQGVSHLAEACKRLGIPLIHLSTGYVFDGKKATAYRETESVNPLNVYGKTKLAGEEALKATLEQYIILRLGWVFSERRTNFVRDVVRLSGELSTLEVVDDQLGSPTPASDVARVILAIIKQLDCGVQAWGTYHYCGDEAVSRFEFACELVGEVTKHYPVKVKEVVAVKTKQYAYRAPRIHNERMDCQKILNVFGIRQRPWRSEMERVVCLCCGVRRG